MKNAPHGEPLAQIRLAVDDIGKICGLCLHKEVLLLPSQRPHCRETALRLCRRLCHSAAGRALLERVLERGKAARGLLAGGKLRL